MCAIAGFLEITTALPQNSSQLLLMMLHHMQHRGPDGFGQHVDFTAQVAFGHARLSIIAPSQEGRQPFFSGDGSVVVVFNGEIYNYQELRTELQNLGHHFITNTDTEVLVAAYLEWGNSFVEKLIGMFAIGLFDKTLHKFLLIRDRIGAKPVFFSMQGGLLSFVSEMKAILELPWIKKEVNNLAIYDFLTFMSIPAPKTFFKNIYKLPAGYILEINANKKLSFTQWYCPIQAVATQQQQQAKLTDAEVEQQTTMLLEIAIKRRFVSDVPVAIFLSGGLDSSLITALAARGGHRLATFNVSFKNDKNSDEKRWARMVAEMFCTTHHEIEIAEEEIPALATKMLAACDQPLADCVNLPLLKIAETCSSQKFKVALVGEGADEIFFGYPEYKKYNFLDTVFNNPCMNLLPKWFFKGAFCIGRKTSVKEGLLNIFFNKAYGLPLYWGGAVAFQEYEKDLLRQALNQSRFEHDEIVEKIYPSYEQGPGSQNLINFFIKKIAQSFPQADFAQKIALLELKHRIPELLLARVDAMTMAAGVEGREPLLDHQLLEFILALPRQQRTAAMELKFLLKKVAIKFLPQELVYRTKKGFGAPVQNWLERKVFPASPPPENWPHLKSLPLPQKSAVKFWTLHCLKQFFQKNLF